MRSVAFFVSGPQKIFLCGDVCRILIRRKKLRQGNVARLLRVSDGQLSKYLSGRCRVPGLVLSGLAEILGVDPSLITRPAASVEV